MKNNIIQNIKYCAERIELKTSGPYLGGNKRQYKIWLHLKTQCVKVDVDICLYNISLLSLNTKQHDKKVLYSRGKKQMGRIKTR